MRNQSQYDLLTGSSPQGVATFRETLRTSQAMKPGSFLLFSARTTSSLLVDLGNEDLRAQLYKALFDSQSLKEEREVTHIRHQEEVRTAHSQAESERKRFVVS